MDRSVNIYELIDRTPYEHYEYKLSSARAEVQPKEALKSIERKIAVLLVLAVTMIILCVWQGLMFIAGMLVGSYLVILTSLFRTRSYYKRSWRETGDDLDVTDFTLTVYDGFIVYTVTRYDAIMQYKIPLDKISNIRKIAEFTVFEVEIGYKAKRACMIETEMLAEDSYFKKGVRK